jgi:ubiquinone/menaquinone biosynthesis C-methylase UbiE
MAEYQIRFEDGAGYERMMGIWSRLAGDIFLDWLAPRPGLRWIDVGCGNGAFTELLVEHCAPAEIQGIDPSDAQLAFARGRPSARSATFQKGDAMTLPFPASSFDAAVMALVIFFVPKPAKGVAEMVRVVRPGGIVSAYAWDVPGGGLPGAPIQAEMRVMGLKPPLPPSFEASRLESLRELWTAAGLEAVETRAITVQRTFANFQEFWAINLLGASIAAVVATMSPSDAELLKSRVRTQLSADAEGRITYSARANAVKGRTPK